MSRKNFHDLHLESMTQLNSHSFKHPLFEEPLPGHLFLSQQLPIQGSEIGMHCLEAFKAIPYYHKHTLNEGTYIFYSGEGEFQVDGKIIPIREGSIIHVKPQGIRTWRNTSDRPLFWICIQSSHACEFKGDIQDGTAFKKEVTWS